MDATAAASLVDVTPAVTKYFVILPVNLAISGSGKAYLVGRHMWRDFFIIEKRGNYYSFPNDQNLPKTGKELAY